MIKKDSRPIRLAAQSLQFAPEAKPPPTVFFRLLRSVNRMLHSKGFVSISTYYNYDPQLENYAEKRFLTRVEAIYVGKRKCKDALLRRRFRGVRLGGRSLDIGSLL